MATFITLTGTKPNINVGPYTWAYQESKSIDISRLTRGGYSSNFWAAAKVAMAIVK